MTNATKQKIRNEYELAKIINSGMSNFIICIISNYTKDEIFQLADSFLDEYHTSNYFIDKDICKALLAIYYNCKWEED